MTPKTITPNDPRIGEFERLLTGGEWLHADDITKAMGWNDKLIRDLASASGGRIASTQQGYKLTEQMTGSELRASINPMRSQADKMRRRARRTEAVWHAVHSLGREMELNL